jgi:hypothetical protein
METIFAWIVDRLRWLFVAATLGGVALIATLPPTAWRPLPASRERR